MRAGTRTKKDRDASWADTEAPEDLRPLGLGPVGGPREDFGAQPEPVQFSSCRRRFVRQYQDLDGRRAFACHGDQNPVVLHGKFDQQPGRAFQRRECCRCVRELPQRRSRGGGARPQQHDMCFRSHVGRFCKEHAMAWRGGLRSPCSQECPETEPPDNGTAGQVSPGRRHLGANDAPVAAGSSAHGSVVGFAPQWLAGSTRAVGCSPRAVDPSTVG